MPSKPSIKAKGNGVIIHLRVQPQTSRTRLTVEPTGQLRLAITAPPVDGQANRAVVIALAKVFDVPKQSVSLVSGEKSRDKSVFIDGIDVETVSSLLSELP